MAAFDWLDFATGTDGCGSLRAPDAVQGLFLLRASHGMTSTKGIIPWGTEFDTFGGFARDIPILETINCCLSDSISLQACSHKPKKIFYPSDFWPVAEESQKALLNEFIARLEEYTGTTCVPINLDNNWKANNPIGTDKSLAEYFHTPFPMDVCSNPVPNLQNLPKRLHHHIRSHTILQPRSPIQTSGSQP